MKTNIFLFFFTFLAIGAHASVDMRRINIRLFVHQPEEDFSKIVVQDPAKKEQLVRYLFEHDLINHQGTRAFAVDAQFDPYYRAFGSQYKLLDLNNDHQPELVFEGLVSNDDEKEHVEIYTVRNGVPKRIYDELGHFPAYKIQPNTGEILLYQHQYPCCLNASHMILRLRLVEGEMQSVKRYFVAREANDMKGHFFPEKTRFTGKLFKTKKKVELRWSKEVITKNAWQLRSQKNSIATYPKGAMYQLLAKENGWMYVRMQTAPENDPENKVINTANFEETAIYGWLKSGKD